MATVPAVMAVGTVPMTAVIAPGQQPLAPGH